MQSFRSRIAITAAALLPLVWGGANVHAQMPGAYPMLPGQTPMGLPGTATGYPMPPNPLAELNLTADQLAKMKEIGQAAEKKNTATAQKLVEQAAKLSQQVAAERPDPKAAGALFAEIAALQRQLLEAGVETQNLQTDVLTPEQKVKWRAFQQGARFSGR